MTSVTHAKVSAIADGPDAARVQPSDWNAEHDVAIAAADVPLEDAGGYFSSTDIEGALQELGEANAAAGALGAWTNYTPALTADTTNPTLGNGSLVGRYKAFDAHTYAISISFTFGSTSNAGNGIWSFSLPPGVTAVARSQTLSCEINDANVTHWAAVAVVNAGATKVTHIVPGDGAAPRVVTNTIPMTWQAGDTIHINGIIEVA